MPGDLKACPVIVAGAVVGRVTHVDVHPNGDHIWLANVELGNSAGPLRIVFGGHRRVTPGDLVPVAPPGVRVQVRPGDETTPPRVKKMRVRQYRGERSHGMLCSLDELGWTVEGPDEVAVLLGLDPGVCLHSIPVDRRPSVVDRPEYLMLADVHPVALETEPQPAAMPGHRWWAGPFRRSQRVTK
jgi:tRNA-binding EMAP/Myf-like protein